MRTSMPHSFRRRLFVAFLAVSLVPLLLCSAMLLQIFRLRMTDAAGGTGPQGIYLQRLPRA